MTQIKGFEDYTLYFDDEGHPWIWSDKKGRFMTPYKGERDYSYMIMRDNDGLRKTKKMHRLVGENCIPNPHNHPVVDHIDGNTLNNNINNLRWLSWSDNSHNTTKRKNYNWCKRNKKWKVAITINKKSVHLGYFKTEEEARKAYEDASRKHHPGVRRDLMD